MRCICAILPASYRLSNATGLCCFHLSDDNVGLQIIYAYLQTAHTTKEQLKKPYPYSTTADIINKEVFSLHDRQILSAFRYTWICNRIRFTGNGCLGICLRLWLHVLTLRETYIKEVDRIVVMSNILFPTNFSFLIKCDWPTWWNLFCARRGPHAACPVIKAHVFFLFFFRFCFVEVIFINSPQLSNCNP